VQIAIETTCGTPLADNYKVTYFYVLAQHDLLVYSLDVIEE
jgi:hypothetical protein